MAEELTPQEIADNFFTLSRTFSGEERAARFLSVQPATNANLAVALILARLSASAQAK